MTYLADVNVRVALAVVDHTHHVAAMEWLEKSDADDIAFCRVTQNGFLRLLTNRRVLGDDVLTAPRAWDVYDMLRRNSRVVFASEPHGLETAWREATRHSHTGPNFWTDAYLTAFAFAKEYTLVTFDRALARQRRAHIRLLESPPRVT